PANGSARSKPRHSERCVTPPAGANCRGSGPKSRRKAHSVSRAVGKPSLAIDGRLTVDGSVLYARSYSRVSIYLSRNIFACALTLHLYDEGLSPSCDPRT